MRAFRFAMMASLGLAALACFASGLWDGNTRTVVCGIGCIVGAMLVAPQQENRA